MVRLFDSVLSWLMRPRVRRLRRWSFLLTLPIALIVARVFGIEQAALVVALRALLWSAVAVAAWRVAGERGEALRDLLMHPRARAIVRTEFDVLTALPRLLARRVARRSQAGTAYHRGTFGLALALAFTPVVMSETVALHLLLHGTLIAWVLDALHVYMLIWLWGFALGPRAFPHRIGARSAVLRNGAMYRVRVPLAAIASATVRSERVGGERRIAERDGAVLLPARGRVDVWLEFDEPVRVQRPFQEPLTTRRLAIASDEPDLLVEPLLAGETVPRGAGSPAGLLSVLDGAGLLRDAAQPA